ncbi:GumC family protein [Novosphingobium endophyticum]|nr:polysaccharide biosynthesis tyrosine autokinase [Novosphingobium endophyticum]
MYARPQQLTHIDGHMDGRGDSAPVDEGALIDLRAFMQVLRRRRLVIILVSLVVFAAATAAYFTTPPVYTSTTTVALERGGEKVVQVDQVVPDVAPDSAAVDTEVAVLKSPGLIGKVVDDLQLTRYPEFNPALETGEVVPEEAQRKRAVTTVLGNMTASRNGFSYAIDISYASESPAMAAKVANKIAETYIGEQVATKSGATSRASDFLEGQLDELRAQVESAEAAVASYRASHGLFDLGGNSSVTQEEITTLNAQLAQARAEEAEARARLSTANAQLARGGSGEELGESLDSPVVSSLRSQRAKVSGRVAALRQQYGPRYPELTRTQQELQDIDEQISSEVRRIVANLSIQANAAGQRTGSIMGSLQRAKGTLAVDNKASVGLSELERRAESARTLYQTFLDRYKQTRAQRGLERADSYIVAEAQVPALPSSPNVLIFAVIGLIGAIAGSTVVVAILQLLDRGVETTSNLEKKLGMRVLGSIPDTKHLPELEGLGDSVHPTQLIVDRPQSSFAEAFRWLQTSIHFNQRDRGPVVVAITSALPNEGKTTAALSLARSAAMAGKRTILVDCDLRRRVSSTEPGPMETIGLRALLDNQGQLDDAIYVDPETGLFVLPRRNDEHHIQPFADSAAFSELIAALRAKFDFIVLDTPPVLTIDDSRVIAAKADSVILMVRWRKTPTRAAELALRHLDSVGANVIGATLSMVDVTAQARIGYEDASYYYGAYKSYYA